MKKINILLLLVLIVRTAAIAQEKFYPIDRNEKEQKELIERSTLIIEGKRTKSKGRLYGNNEAWGAYYYILYEIKPTSVLKGNADSAKTYLFLIKSGECTFAVNGDTHQYEENFGCINPYENAGFIPEYGIFFINEKTTPVANAYRKMEKDGKLTPIDLNSLFPNAIMVGFEYCISYGKEYPKDKVLKFLLDKHKLEAVPLK